MKRLLLMQLALVCCGWANAQAAPDKATVDRCQQEGGILVIAATGRDQGITPQEMLKMVADASAVPLDRRKKLINLAYFDPSMSTLHPGPHDEGFVQATYAANCERNFKPEFVPLK
jgi:hypothetical protein